MDDNILTVPVNRKKTDIFGSEKNTEVINVFVYNSEAWKAKYTPKKSW